MTTTNIDDKMVSLNTLGHTKDPKLAQKLLEMTLTDDVKPQDLSHAVGSVGANNATRHVLWQFIQENWDRVFERYGQNKVSLEKWFKFGFNQFSEPDMSQQMQHYFSSKDIRGIERVISVACDLTDANSKYRQRDEKLVLEWLEAHGYA